MKLQQLLNEGSTSQDLEVKAIIKQIREKKASTSNSFGTVPFGSHKVINGKVEHTSKQLILGGFFFDADGVLLLPFSSAKAVEVRCFRMTSFKGFPEVIRPGYYGSSLEWDLPAEGGNYKVTDWEGFPKEFVGEVNLNHSKYSELRYDKWHKVVKSLEGGLYIHLYYKGPLMSLLMVPGLTRLGEPPNPPLEAPAKIINKYLKGDRDVMECQEELIQAGLKEYARI